MTTRARESAPYCGALTSVDARLPPSSPSVHALHAGDTFDRDWRRLRRARGFLSGLVLLALFKTFVRGRPETGLEWTFALGWIGVMGGLALLSRTHAVVALWTAAILFGVATGTVMLPALAQGNGAALFLSAVSALIISQLVLGARAAARLTRSLAPPSTERQAEAKPESSAEGP